MSGWRSGKQASCCSRGAGAGHGEEERALAHGIAMRGDTAAIIDTRTPVRLPLGITAVMGIAVWP